MGFGGLCLGLGLNRLLSFLFLSDPEAMAMECRITHGRLNGWSLIEIAQAFRKEGAYCARKLQGPIVALKCAGGLAH